MTHVTTTFGPRATAREVLAGQDLSGRRIIVTGGAAGLGSATVRALAGAGAHVTIATRNPRLAKALTDEFPRTEAVALDLADLDSVNSFCMAWEGPLDAVVANAGVMALPERQVSAEGWEMQLATNFLGHFALVTGLRSALRSAGNGRVVTVSSGAHLLAGFDFDDPHFERRPYDPVIAYAQSKTAAVLLAVGVSRRWAADGITANACCPGIVRTNLMRHLDTAMQQSIGAADAEGNAVTPAHFKTPEEGAATSTLLAASPLVEGVTGRYFEDNQEARVVKGGRELIARGPEALIGLVAEWSVDPGTADRLWEYAASAVPTE